MKEEFLKLKDVQRILNVSRTTLFRLRKENLISEIKVRGSVRVKREDLDKFLNDNSGSYLKTNTAREDNSINYLYPNIFKGQYADIFETAIYNDNNILIYGQVGNGVNVIAKSLYVYSKTVGKDYSFIDYIDYDNGQDIRINPNAPAIISCHIEDVNILMENINEHIENIKLDVIAYINNKEIETVE